MPNVILAFGVLFLIDLKWWLILKPAIYYLKQ